MSHSGNKLQEQTDPCAVDSAAGRWAFVWTIGVLVIASVLVGKLSRIDDWMYKNDAEVLDMAAYNENRMSQTSITRDNFDARRTLVTTLIKEE